MLRLRLLALALLLFAFSALAQVPSPDEFLGYPSGARFTPWSRIVDYYETAAAKSDLLTLERIGETYEHRPLLLATITSAANRARLGEIQSNLAAIAAGDLDAASKPMPAVVWLAFGVHGNESSSAEASMRVVANLLRDPESRKLLEDLVVIIDPLQNPDGRERYVQWFARARGERPNPNPDALEHQEPWPGGRTNHYLVDMNRDWAWSSQRETRARLAAYRRWNPQVFVDFHEMGTSSSYFFPPDAKPINANLPREVESWLETFGKANAEAFTRNGWPFFVGERFDLFYPGYGDSWPSLHGAVGMTYEVAGGGRGGTEVRREDGTTLTLAHRIDEHTTTAMVTLRTAAAHRAALRAYTAQVARTQTESGKNVYFLVPGSPNFEPLIDLLLRQDIAVGMLSAPLTVRATRIDGNAAEPHTFATGTAVVTTRQPLGALVQTLLERNAVFSKGYVEEQRQKTEADEPDDFYDLTSWSLPLAANVETWAAAAPLTAATQPYAKPARPPFRPASYGYVVDGNAPNLYRFAGALLRAGINFSVSEGEVVAGEHSFVRGSLILLKGNNAADLDVRLAGIGKETGVTPYPVESGWTGGTPLGSERVHYVRDPKIALVGGSGVSSSSFGMLWFTLDVETDVPHSVVALESLRSIDLSRYRVLVLPDGDGYADRLGKKGIERLQTWVRDGGTVVAISEASAFLRDKDVALSKLKPWEPPKKKDEEKDKSTAEERYNEPRVPGAAFRSVASERSYLTFGVPRPPVVLIEGTTALLPASHKVDNILTIDAKDPLVSGVAWPESLERIRGAAYLVSEPYGKGTVITFADQPHFRLFWRSTLPLLMNAVLYSPSFPR